MSNNNPMIRPIFAPFNLKLVLMHLKRKIKNIKGPTIKIVSEILSIT